MKKTSVFTRLIAATLFTSVLMISCKKETSDSLSPAQEEEAVTMSSESEAENEVVFNDVLDNVLGVNAEVGIGGTGIFGRVSSSINGRETGLDSLPGCTKVYISFLNPPNRFPARIVIDFGRDGCLGRDGHMRFGRIITEYTGPLTVPGNSATTVFDGFKFDSIAVQGKHTVSNTTAAGSNQRQFTIEVTDAKLTRPNGNYSLWTSHRIITQIEGNGTVLPIDDIFKITGSAHGKVQRNNVIIAWKSEIGEPLIKKFACRWISKGTIRVRRENQSNNTQWTAILDYGQGTCDYFATLTINGVTRQIQLPH